MKRFGIIVVLALMISVTMDCNLLSFFGHNSVPVSSSAPLLTVTYTGGLCVYGACGAEYTVTMDGTITYTRGDGTNRNAQITDEELATLAEAIATADYEALMSEPFTDVCPIAYDGQEVIYTFVTPTGEKIIDSCVHVIQEDAELFRVVNELLEAYSELAE